MRDALVEKKEQDMKDWDLRRLALALEDVLGEEEHSRQGLKAARGRGPKRTRLHTGRKGETRHEIVDPYRIPLRPYLRRVRSIAIHKPEDEVRAGESQRFRTHATKTPFRSPEELRPQRIAAPKVMYAVRDKSKTRYSFASRNLSSAHSFGHLHLTPTRRHCASQPRGR